MAGLVATADCWCQHLNRQMQLAAHSQLGRRFFTQPNGAFLVGASISFFLKKMFSFIYHNNIHRACQKVSSQHMRK
jgi:hypothetical protein